MEGICIPEKECIEALSCAKTCSENVAVVTQVSHGSAAAKQRESDVYDRHTQAHTQIQTHTKATDPQTHSQRPPPRARTHTHKHAACMRVAYLVIAVAFILGLQQDVTRPLHHCAISGAADQVLPTGRDQALGQLEGGPGKPRFQTRHLLWRE